MIESDAIVLAAGKQTRYGLEESKLMARIDQQPAFYFTINNILKVIPEEFITVVSSALFQDFNDYITNCYQKVNLTMDATPGSGSAQSLKSSLPWKSENVFVTEGNIYYESYLVAQLFQMMSMNSHLVAVLSVTPKVEVASTHRKVVNGVTLDLTGGVAETTKHYKNMGAYVLNHSFQEYIDQCPDVIAVLNYLNLSGFPVTALNYYGPYLHIETPKDVASWKSHLLRGKKNTTEEKN